MKKHNRTNKSDRLKLFLSNPKNWNKTNALLVQKHLDIKRNKRLEDIRRGIINEIGRGEYL